MTDNPFRHLPAVHDVLALLDLTRLPMAHATAVTMIRAELDQLRLRMKAGETCKEALTPTVVAATVMNRLIEQDRPTLRRVINATGIVLHTNLGRAPLAEEAARAAYEAGRGYLNLELDLATGKRSSRPDAVRAAICRLTGAESATVVNNNAAATVLVLRAICRDKEVIVSRGQLVEIGGSFRIPEIMAVSGAILREVGTTNITRVSDYEAAIGPNTGALLRVHTSNYRITGFTEAVAIPELVALGRKHDLPVIDDVGSGALLDFRQFGLDDEPQPRASIAAGADLVLFSGDKLLGGPQAGLIAGKARWIEKIERDPLMRAFRVDKMTLAALNATLRIYFDEKRALRELPVMWMLQSSPAELRRRAEALAEALRALDGLTATVAEDVAFVGGGSLPGQSLPSWIVELVNEGDSEEAFAQRLRQGDPAVVARLQGGRLVLDLRTVFVQQESELVDAIRRSTIRSAKPSQANGA